MEKRTIGPFRLEEQLGAGGMGVVYLATYLKTDQSVALKILPPALSADDKLVARFEREMAILKKLKHQNIVPYYGGWKHEGQHFYAMKLMTGGSIEDILKTQGRMPWTPTVEYALQLCKALEYAHKHGVIHRDLKPANLFLTEDGRLCLGDFGIARDMDATALTAAGFTVGTYAYMAPEQITGKAPVSHKTDLYALGCVLFEMLTGRTPYHSHTQAEMLFQHVQGDVPRISDFINSCPDAIAEQVTRLLQKDPNDRPHDASFVHYSLNQAKKSVAAAVRSATAHEAAVTIEDVHPELTKLVDRKKLREKRRKKRGKKRNQGPIYERMWFLAGCLLLLLGIVSWVLWPPSEQELFSQAQTLMESDDPVQWQEAQDHYLTPLLERFPDGAHSQQAHEYIDKLAMYRAERRALTNARLGREPQSEAERLFIAAWRFEEFGDRVTAIEKYRSLAELLKDRPEDQTFVQLARRKIVAIEANGSVTDDRVDVVKSALARADDLFRQGHVIEARKIWNSIITLYSSDREFEPLVQQCRARLSGHDEPKPAD